MPGSAIARRRSSFAASSPIASKDSLRARRCLRLRSSAGACLVGAFACLALARRSPPTRSPTLAVKNRSIEASVFLDDKIKADARAGRRLPRRGQEVDRQERRRGRELAQAGSAILQATAPGVLSANTTPARWSTGIMSASSGPTTWTPAARIRIPTSTRSCGTRPKRSASASVPSSPRPPITARP